MGRRRRKKLPTEAVETIVESLSHEGRGIGHVNGKTVFIDGALPGETVTFRYRRSRSSFAEGIIESLLQDPSPDRVEAGCPHFLVCGGCSLQHLHAEKQLAHKESVLEEQFRHIGGLEDWQKLPPLTGPLWAYRHKARLGVRYVMKKEKVLVGFREKYSNYIAELSTCEVLHPTVGKRLDALAELIGSLSVYNRIAQIEVAVDDTNTALIFRNLEPLSGEDRQKMVEFGERFNIQVYMQPGGPDSVKAITGEDYAPLYYEVDDGEVRIQFAATDFTQVNTEINRAMVKRVLEFLAIEDDDHVLDLFCGVGNFTLPIARRAASVTGIEGSEALVEKARQNASLNGLDNVNFIAQDLHKEASLTPEMAFTKLLLDPPRSGAEEVVSNWDLSGLGRIVYVSCNPATLARDAAILVQKRGFKLVSAGIMDMFPHTAHVESIAIFDNE